MDVKQQHKNNLLPAGTAVYDTLYRIPYFFGCKTEFFSFQNNPKDLDPSCKTDLDLWDCLGRVVVVVVVALLFYVHGKHLRSCRDGQLT